MRAEIEHRFSARPALINGDRAAVLEGCRLLACGLDELLPDSREKALALTALEQAMFWATAAVARQGDE